MYKVIPIQICVHMTFIELIMDIPVFFILAISLILAIWRIKDFLEFF